MGQLHEHARTLLARVIQAQTLLHESASVPWGDADVLALTALANDAGARFHSLANEAAYEMSELVAISQQQAANVKFPTEMFAGRDSTLKEDYHRHWVAAARLLDTLASEAEIKGL